MEKAKAYVNNDIDINEKNASNDMNIIYEKDISNETNIIYKKDTSNEMNIIYEKDTSNETNIIYENNMNGIEIMEENTENKGQFVILLTFNFLFIIVRLILLLHLIFVFRRKYSKLF